MVGAWIFYSTGFAGNGADAGNSPSILDFIGSAAVALWLDPVAADFAGTLGWQGFLQQRLLHFFCVAIPIWIP